MREVFTGQGVARKVFTPPEQWWIDSKVFVIMKNSSSWVETWTAFIAARSNVPLVFSSIEYTQESLWKRKKVEGYWYDVEFLAGFSVRHTVVQACLDPANRAAFARELQTRPYETEVLRGHRYTGSAITGVLAENPGQGPRLVDVLVPCTHCKKKFAESVLSCPWCGAPR